MERIFLWLLSGFLAKLRLFENSIVLFSIGNLHNIVDEFKSANYFTYCPSVPLVLHQNETERILNPTFSKSELECIPRSETLDSFEIKNNTPIPVVVISEETQYDLWNYRGQNLWKTLAQKVDTKYLSTACTFWLV